MDVEFLQIGTIIIPKLNCLLKLFIYTCLTGVNKQLIYIIRYENSISDEYNM